MWGEITNVQVISILNGSPEFNYFFTLVSTFGFVAYCVGLLVKVGSRS